jgi:hypothetical protein
MQYASLNSAKYFALGCAALLISLVVFGQNAPVGNSELEGVVDAVSQRDGIVLGLAVKSEDQIIAVNAPLQLQGILTNAGLDEGQWIKLMVTNVRGTKRGVVCTFVSIVSLGPAPERDLSAPKRDAPLPVDDLKPGLGIKGM